MKRKKRKKVRIKTCFACNGIGGFYGETREYGNIVVRFADCGWCGGAGVFGKEIENDVQANRGGMINAIHK